MQVYLTLGRGNRKQILANVTRAQWMALTAKITKSLPHKLPNPRLCLVLMDGEREVDRILRVIA